MKTVFFILCAILRCNVEGNKIRAIRTRLIQYLPYNQNIHPQSQYFSGLPQKQRALNYRNGKQIYSYKNPGDVRFHMLGEREAYAAYLKKYLNRGQVHQNVHYYNWPSSAIQGISAPADQNRLNSGYNGLIGQSAYQSWQNSASGSPIGISVEQSGINPGHRGNIHTVYQSWQNSAGGGAVDASLQQNGVNSGQRGNIALYQNWQNSASAHPNEASVESSELSPENIDQSIYQSWQDGGRPIDIPIKQSNLYPGHIKSTYQSLQSSAPESPVDLSIDQTEFNTRYNETDQSEDQIWKNFGNGGEIKLPVDQIVPNSTPGGKIDTVQQNVMIFGQNSENGGQPIFSLYQGGLNQDSKPEFNDITNEINVNTEGNTEPNHPVTEHDLILSVDGSKIYQPNETPLQDIANDMIIDNEENISPIRVVKENHLISPDNEDIISGEQSNLNWAVQEPFKEIQFNNEERISPVSAVTENDIDFPNNEGMITNDSVTEHDLKFSENGSKLNQPNETPLQDIVKNTIINNEENISPIGVKSENYLISPDNEDIISGDQSNLSWAVQGPFKESQFNNKEIISPVSPVTENDKDFPNNEGMISVFPADQTPLKDIEKEVHVNNEENVTPANFITEGDQISPDDIDNMALLTDMANNEEKSVPISTEPVNDLISADDVASFVGQSELNEATGAPLRQILGKTKINNAENSDSVTLIENNPISIIRPHPIYPNIFKPDQQQNAVPRYLHISKPNQQESLVSRYPYVLKQNQRQSPGYTKTWNKFTTPSQGYPLNISYKMPPGILQWIKSISRNVSPQHNNAFSSVCLNPNTNNIPWPRSNRQDIIEYIKTLGMSDSPQIIYKNTDTPKIGSTNADHTNPNFYQEIYPYKPNNKPNNININKHNIPQPKYYVPTTSVQNGFHIQPEILNRHKYPLPNQDEEVRTKDPDSSVIYIEPYGVEHTFATRSPVPESRQPITSKITGYEEPKHLTRTTPKQYVYRLIEASMPELMRLYHSKCDNGYEEKLLNEFKNLIDSIQGEHCEIL